MCESVDLCGWSGERDASLFLKGDGVNHLKMEIREQIGGDVEEVKISSP